MLYRVQALASAIAGLAIISCQPSIAAAPPVEAEIYSTMPSTAQHRPEMALDGDVATYFKSAYGMDDGDDFLIRLSRQVRVDKIHIVTGDLQGNDLLARAVVETSVDGVTFETAAHFGTDGVADAHFRRRKIAALRIRLDHNQSVSNLIIREIEIDSKDKIAHVELGPGRGFVDTSQAPDLVDWARRAEQEMEEFWPDTAALLYSDGFITPNMVNVVYRTGKGVTDVAATGGGQMVVNADWCRKHPDDTGLTVHEMAHVVQAFDAYDPVWLVEGTADYIRWVKFEPQNFHPRIDVKKATYHDAYRTTAAFLGWCELHYDSCLVTQLNRAVRVGSYRNDLFKEYCGKDVDTLWGEFIAAYRADPADILTPPLPAADRPRAAIAVTPGTSAPVDLSSAFDIDGVTVDGSAFAADGGLDDGGAAYSATILGKSLDTGGVHFDLGPVGKPNVASCHGNVITLPSGQYASLWLLGATVNGGKKSQRLTVTYADGSVDDVDQNFSDWHDPRDYPGEARALLCPYRNMSDGTKDNRPFYVYAYGFSINPKKSVKDLTLPDASNVKILAVTVAK